MTALRAHFAEIALAGFLLIQAGTGAWTALNRRGVDFAVYYLSAQALRRGRDIYALTDAEWAALAEQSQIAEYTKPYLYPPPTAGFVSLFAGLPYQTALLVWNALSLAALTLAGCALSQLLSRGWIDPLVFAIFALYVPMLTTVYAGQVNHFVLLALAAYLLFMQRKRLFAAGAAFAAGLMIKPIAAPLIVHLAWRRDWRAIGAIAAGLIAMVLVSVTLTGPQSHLAYLQNGGQLSSLSLGAAPVTYPPNQSLFGFFGRLLTTNEFAPAWTDSPDLARALAIGTAALLLIGVAMLTWPRRNGAETFALETGLVLVTINLIAPTSWYHHAVISIIPLLLAWRAAPSREWRAALIAALILIDAQGLLWHRFEGHTLLLSLGTYGLLIIYAVNATLVYRLKKNPASVAVERQLLLR